MTLCTKVECSDRDPQLNVPDPGRPGEFMSLGKVFRWPKFLIVCTFTSEGAENKDKLLKVAMLGREVIESEVTSHSKSTALMYFKFVKIILSRGHPYSVPCTRRGRGLRKSDNWWRGGEDHAWRNTFLLVIIIHTKLKFNFLLWLGVIFNFPF